MSPPHNAKLGGAIWSWSIPARITCPGKSHSCARACYATKANFTTTLVRARLVQNYLASRHPQFVAMMRDLLRRHGVSILRIHVAGDFYSEQYTRKWFEIVQATPRVVFFAYTRSWRDLDIFPALVALGQLPNMHLWWSTDRETGPAPPVYGIRAAYMAVNDRDAAHAPPDVDLVFRVRRQTAMKSAHGVLVCPAENGVRGKWKHTCTTCRVCFTARRRPQWERFLTADDALAQGDARCWS